MNFNLARELRWAREAMRAILNFKALTPLGSRPAAEMAGHPSGVLGTGSDRALQLTAKEEATAVRDRPRGPSGIGLRTAAAPPWNGPR